MEIYTQTIFFPFLARWRLQRSLWLLGLLRDGLHCVRLHCHHPTDGATRHAALWQRRAWWTYRTKGSLRSVHAHAVVPLCHPVCPAGLRRYQVAVLEMDSEKKPLHRVLYLPLSAEIA